MFKKSLVLLFACMLTQSFSVAEELEIPPVGLDPGVVNRFHRDLINELMEKEVEPKEDESEKVEAPKNNEVNVSNKVQNEEKNVHKLQGKVESTKKTELEEVVLNKEETSKKEKDTEGRPFKLKFMYDNDGNEAIGQNRAIFLLSKENLFGWGHELYGGAVLGRGTTGVVTGYRMPINKRGTELQFDYSYTNVHLLNDFSKYYIGGNTQTFSTRVVHPLWDKNDWEVKTDLGIDFVRTSASGFIEDEDRSLNDYTLTVLRHGVNAIKRDKYGVFTGRVESSFGLPIMGAKEDSTDYFNNTTGNSQSAFYKFRASLLRLQKLPKDCLGIVRITGQYTPQNLYFTEKMNFGGLNSLRGFEPGETLSDVGVNGTFELRTPVPFLSMALPENYKHLSKKVNLGFFYDWGVLSNQHTGVKMTGYSNFLQSIGCGVHLKLTKNLTASWEIGMPVGSSIHAGKDAVSYFTLKADLLDLVPRKKHSEKKEEI